MDAYTGQVVIHPDAPSVLLSKPHHPIWKDTLLFPAYFAILSVVVLLLYGISVSKPVQSLLPRLYPNRNVPNAQETNDAVSQEALQHNGVLADIKLHVNAKGGPVIFAYKVLRLVGCLALVGFTIATLIIDEQGRESSFLDALKKKKKKKKHARASDEFTEAEWLQVALCLAYTYASFLALVSVAVSRRWAKTANFHLVSLLLFTWAVFAYRDFWPLMTYTLRPADIGDKLLWPKFVLLTLTAIGIPLLIPRPYVPFDPKDPAKEPNPEQTTPLLSLVLYSFLDPVIFKAYRIPHLPASQFPPLADYDRAKNLRKRSFKYLDHFSGARKEHLFFSLMRVFRGEYIGISLMTIIKVLTLYASPIGINRLLRYLEDGGSNAVVRPWLWVSWLFFGPVIGSIAMQWYIFLTTGTLVRTEGIITQLVFEHALRIRMKAQTSEGQSSSRPSTATTTPDTASIADSDVTAEGTTLNGNGSEVPPSIASVESDAGKGKRKTSPTSTDPNAPATKSTSSTSNLVGKLNNLITTDLQNIVEGRDFIMLVVQSPLLVAIGIVFLYIILGWSAFVGLVVMVLLFPIPGYVAKLTQTVQIERMKKTDARVQTVTETMNVIRMIKLFGWEPKMNKSIAEKRDDELKLIKKRQFLDISNGTLNFVIPILTMIATFITYTLIMKQQLTASTVFSSMAVFDMLRDQLHLIFFMVPACIQAKVSLDRVTEYLSDTELLDEFQVENKERTEQIEEFSAAPKDPDVIGFCDAAFVWSNVDGSLTPSRRRFRLTLDGEVIFKRGGLNLIIGPTGSGKTSLLMALLGEMHSLPSGPTSWYNLPRDKGVAYAAQESWVQNETIRDNILFGSPYDEERYKKVIYQCGLERDLTLFDAGDQTEVGEKGLTLSGGQKARITLARAVYSSADILLLDDVLAALDVHTSRWVVEKCFNGDLVRGRTVLLVTHNVVMASPIASYVVSLGTDGRVANQGSVAEAMATDKEMQDEIEKSEAAIKKGEEASTDDDVKGEEVKKSDGKLVVAEEIAEGHVSWPAIKLYLFNLGGPLFWFCFLSSMFVVDFASVIQTWYLGYWASQYEDHPASEVSVPYHLTVFTSILLFGVIMYFIGYVLYIFGSIKASKTIHEQLIAAITGTTLRWLDSTPSGRIVARCTQDISAVDGTVSQHLGWVIELTITLLIRLAAVVYMTPIFIVPGIVVGALGSWFGQIYIKAQLSVKREMSNAKSPVLSHFGAAVTGLVSIRAFGAQDMFKSETLARIDRYVRSARTFYNLNRWVCIRIDTLGGLFASGLAAYLVYGKQLGSASNTGFSLNMAVAFSSLILWWVRILNQFEVAGISLERIQGYIEIEQETKPAPDGVPPAYWPSSGKIVVDKLSARYSRDGPKVLYDISFEIKAGERVGVVGRTGSGKSSLTLSLLRCIPTEGNVYYDNIATNDINLDVLRRSITIIPQTPELLSGSLRHNLDPFDENDDATLNDALRSAGLFTLQSNVDEENRINLDTQIAAGGSNLSVGQRQIIALARAIVRRSKLLILDEATSYIDNKTDSVIQSSLRNELGGDVTLITVAHRLKTIMDSDKIMVLDAGRLVEFDTPSNLLKKEGGFLKSLVDQSGDRDALYAMANANSSSSR
ncbi:uncharacterized protein FOMMEDRAFT_106872 [Fomitiporia mediterranea MF3/22]|uniref:uncharacterized protein n=1 Tax=Fomitiporia mediterranea (strain MF3/22) TaxID=694068 RepID=UPI000440763E|nr:uncharacterized protein FOMMEDRAFT_106872 [Fomitiporia mediterranea MF3/22]EJD04272.1 hypothetical protein FOMMEDRAFT_106872 [Fomitiporia mediterranea MF3/22]